MYLSNKQLIDGLIRKGVLQTPAIEDALMEIDRKDFVSEKHKDLAYVDEALPIGYQQTISQPYTVVFMLESLNPHQGERVLDVGSGSGWTTALLAKIVGEEGRVFGVELVPELVRFGKKNLAKYDLEQAEIRQATNELGLQEEAPFDKILVSAADDHVPNELVSQLKVGGVMVIPIQGGLWKVTKVSDKEVETEVYEGFVFVPLVH